MTEFALNHCTGLVEVSSPFGNMFEIFDLDMGFGPHLQAFEISVNFAMGEVLQSSSPSGVQNATNTPHSLEMLQLNSTSLHPSVSDLIFQNALIANSTWEMDQELVSVNHDFFANFTSP